jgi:hypothetical protein
MREGLPSSASAASSAGTLGFEPRFELGLLQRLQVCDVFCLRERAFELVQLRCHGLASHFQPRKSTALCFGRASNDAHFPRRVLTRVLLGVPLRFRTFTSAALGFRFGFPLSRLRFELAQRLHCLLQRTHRRFTPVLRGLHFGFGVEAHTAFAVTLEHEANDELVRFRERFLGRARSLRFLGSGQFFGVQPCNQCELVPIHAAGHRTDLTRALLMMPSRSREIRFLLASRG